MTFKHIPSTIHRATFSFLFSLLLSSCLLVMLLLVSPRHTHGAQVTLGWGPPVSASDVAGYKVYYGMVSNSYSFAVDAGNQTTVTITGLFGGVTYYFAATAYNTEGTESAPSSEVAYTVPGYAGCYTDDGNRALPVVLSQGGETVESCVQRAAQAGYAYAGLQWYGWCFAGNTLGYTQVGDPECNTPCSANPSEMCGGGWRNSIYGTGVIPSSYVGCYTDDSNRALPNTLSTGNETVESCKSKAAQAGYAYAGLQWYGWCFAGNTLGYTQVGDPECNTPCSANPSEMCGGSWRNSIYGTGVTGQAASSR